MNNRIESSLPFLNQAPALVTERKQILEAIAKINFTDKKNLFLTRRFLEEESQKLLKTLELPEKYAAWTMVLLGNSFWRDSITAIPYSRRILLLPHCMRNSQQCQGNYDAEGLHCVRCGACQLCELQQYAESLGYKTLIAEGTPIVMQWILSGKADAILGVGCLKSLERAFDKLVWAGIPAMAVPLFDGTCSDTQTDIDEVFAMIDIPWIPEKKEKEPRTWIHLLREAARLFQEESLDQMFPTAKDSFQKRLEFEQKQQISENSVSESYSLSSEKQIKSNLSNKDVHQPEQHIQKEQLKQSKQADQSKKTDQLEQNKQTNQSEKTKQPEQNKSDRINHSNISLEQAEYERLEKTISIPPMLMTEWLGRDFLKRGGKFYRPFITLAAFDAMSGGTATSEDGEQAVRMFPLAVKKVAFAMELFHKASLIHDDVEDNDFFRYGRPTLHQSWGIPVAVNVGDYLLGVGYHLLAELLKDSVNSAENPSDSNSDSLANKFFDNNSVADHSEKSAEFAIGTIPFEKMNLSSPKEKKACPALTPSMILDILERLGRAHKLLSQGQGAELIWRDGSSKNLKPVDALRIAALKTAPAFDASLYCGLRLASDESEINRMEPLISCFSRYLGIGFQIRNDLDDWIPRFENKKLSGGDIRDGRPTVLWAFALQELSDPQKKELFARVQTIKEKQILLNKQNQCIAFPLKITESMSSDISSDTDLDLEKEIQIQLAEIRQLYENAHVFDLAQNLIDKYAQRAASIADEISPGSIGELLHHFISTILK